MKNKNLPLVSVVITTKNEEENIGNCLESIKRQTYPTNKIEIVVVDNNSTDKTREIAKKYTLKVYNFGPERSAQRNFGINKARGEYVMFLDADMILTPKVIEKAIEKFKNSQLVGLYISEVILGNSFWSQVRRFERSFYDGTVIDCVRIVKKDVFEKVGGFDISLTGPEDWDFDKKVRKLGKVAVLGEYDFEEIHKKLKKINIRRLKKLTTAPIIFHNEAKFNLKKYLAKKSYYAKSFKSYIQKWGKSDPGIRKQFGFCYRYFRVFIENGKWKRLIRHPILTLGMWFLRGLVGGSYLIYITQKKN